MVPDVDLVDNVEMIRDGGSLAATFLDRSNRRFTLFFPIKHTKSGGLFEPKQHLSPVIIDCDPSKRPTNHSEFSGPVTDISWEDARVILKDLDANKSKSTESRRSIFFEEWLQEMIETANRSGAPASQGHE